MDEKATLQPLLEVASVEPPRSSINLSSAQMSDATVYTSDGARRSCSIDQISAEIRLAIRIYLVRPLLQLSAIHFPEHTAFVEEG